MATSAFKSTTKRTPLSSSSSSSSADHHHHHHHHRRSRSVSRFSRRTPAAAEQFETPNRRGKFVNTARGSEYPEISLDDLAIELFTSSELALRGGRGCDVWKTEAEDSKRRGRSVSRNEKKESEWRGVSGCGNGRRRRSVSAVRYPDSDSEREGNPANYSSRTKHHGFGDGRKQKPLMENPVERLQKCSSQKDLSKLHDDNSSHSSALTEDEALDAPCTTDGMRRTFLADHVQKKIERQSSYRMNNSVNGTRQKELRNAVQVKNNNYSSESISKSGSKLDGCDVLQAASTIRKSYATKLEQSELRKTDLLVEMMLEERRGMELKKIVGKSVSNAKETSVVKRQPRSRKRRDDKGIPMQLNSEEAEKIIDDFISSFEDTDISSIDGERSETSSTMEITMKPRDDLIPHRVMENFRSPLSSDTQTVEMDGVVLPWLQWETNSDGSPLPCPENGLLPMSQIVLQDKLEETCTSKVQEQSTHSQSSRGSWSPLVVDNISLNSEETISRTAESDNFKSHILSSVPRRPRFDIDSYLKRPSDEDHLFEKWKNRGMIARGGLLLCHGSFGLIL